MSDLPRSHRESVHVDLAPAELYALVSDVSRTGEWSPVCRWCRWEDPAQAGRVGARFTGHNETPHRTWETTSTVVAAEPGREFAWEVGEGYVRWGFRLEEEDSGTRLTEEWRFTDAGLASFAQRYGAEADEQVADRTQQALTGIPVTLQAIKRIAEGG
jgi:hypothetical protein